MTSEAKRNLEWRAKSELVDVLIDVDHGHRLATIEKFERTEACMATLHPVVVKGWSTGPTGNGTFATYDGAVQWVMGLIK